MRAAESEQRSTFVAWIAPAFLVGAMGSPALAGYSGWWNEKGFGRATAEVTSSTGNKQIAQEQANSPCVGIPMAPMAPAGVTCTEKFLPPGANAQTNAGLLLLPNWVYKNTLGAAGGDSADNNDLASLVKPTSPMATASGDMSSDIISSQRVTFTTTWDLSDQGTAERLRWYYYPLPIDPDFQGDNTDLPNWGTASTLLLQVTHVGPFSDTEMYTIDATNYPTISNFDVANIIVAADGIAVSTPEPSSLALLSGAVLTLLPLVIRRGLVASARLR